jgi:hypothetical protein
MLDGLKSTGLDFPLQWSQIIPVIIGDEAKTLQIEKYLLKHGIQCSGVTPPAVASGKSRLRISINATHTKRHIDTLIGLLTESARAFNLPRAYIRSDQWDAFLESTPDYICDFLKNDNES